MNILITCVECLQTKGMKSVSSFRVPYFEDLISNTTCENGHSIAVVLKAQKFEILMNSGADALLSDYTLEACVNYTAAIDNFYNFAVKVMLIHLNMDDNSYQCLLKEVSGKSERQFGAFLVLHGLVFGCAYNPNQDLVELIHKGKIPSAQQAYEFCALAYQEIVKTSRLLQNYCGNAISYILQNDFNSRLSQVPKNSRVFSSYTLPLFSIESEDNKDTFHEALENFIALNKHTSKREGEVPEVFNSMFEQISELRDIVDQMRSE